MQNNLDYFFVTENTRISHAFLTSFYTIFVLATMGLWSVYQKIAIASFLFILLDNLAINRMPQC